MRQSLLFFSLLSVILFNSGCAILKSDARLDAHNEILNKIANGNLSAEEKLDAFAKDFILLMGEGLDFTNPKKGYKFVNAYGKQNKSSINKIFDEIGAWQKGMTIPQKLAFVNNMRKKPYSKDVMQLVPKFRKKYKQAEFVRNVSKRLTRSLITIGKK